MGHHPQNFVREQKMFKCSETVKHNAVYKPLNQYSVSKKALVKYQVVQILHS